MHKYGESKTTRITTATVRHVTSGSGLFSGRLIFVEQSVPKYAGFAKTFYRRLQILLVFLELLVFLLSSIS